MCYPCVSDVVRVTVALVLVTYVSGAAPKAPCCWSSKWEGIIVQKLGVFDRVSNFASLAEIENVIHVDYDIKKLANEMTVKNGTLTVRVRVIEDFNKKVTYSIVDFQCFKTNLSVPLSGNCIPEDAVYMSENDYLGAKADTWFVGHPAQLNTSTTRVTVSRDGCIPVSQVTLNLADTSMLNILTIQNFTSGIKDPSIFDVPDFCPKSEQYYVPHMRVVGAHNHFVHKIL